MAISSTHTVGTANREDLLDILTMISPTATPFWSRVAHTKAKATVHEWPTEELNTPAQNTDLAAIVEGGDPTYPASQDRVRLTNNVEFISNSFKVSGTQEAVDKAGVRSEIAHQLQNKLKEHKRDTEYRCFNAPDAGVAGGAAVVAQMKPVSAFIDAGNKTAGGGANLTETKLNDSAASCWDEGGDPTLILCNLNTKRQITKNFTAASQRSLEMTSNGDRRLINRIDVYESEVSVFEIVPSRWLDAPVAGDINTYILDTEYWFFAYLRKPQEEKLAKTGDAENRWVKADGCVGNRAPKASAMITHDDGIT